MNKVAVQWALFLALGIVAIAYFVMPIRAAAMPAWSAELWATEAGERLVAVAYSRTPGDAEELVPSLAIMCGKPLSLRYDAGPDEGQPVDRTGQVAIFEFGFGAQRFERELQYEAMDGDWAVTLAAADEILRAIEAGSEVTVLMPNGGLPENSFSLQGSRAAIQEVRGSCR